MINSNKQVEPPEPGAMVKEDDSFAIPLYRYRRSIEVMIDTLKKAVVNLHQEASTLNGRRAKELREIADDFDDYAEDLKSRLKASADQRS